jgi:hypothetical protein
VAEPRGLEDQTGRVDGEQRQIGRLVIALDRRRVVPPVSVPNEDLGRFMHHVMGGQDIALGVHHDAGAALLAQGVPRADG